MSARFQFRLARLLEIRHLQEERERTTYVRLQRKLLETRQQATALQAAVVEQWNVLTAHDEPVQGSLLEHVVLRNGSLRSAEQLALKAASALEQQCERQLQRYLAAHRQSETLESVRERQRSEFLKEQRRHDQQELDNLHCLRSRQSVPSQ